MKLKFENDVFCLVDVDKIADGNGIDVDAFVFDGCSYLKKEGYLMIDTKQESYLDVCESYYDKDGSLLTCEVIAHLELVGAELESDEEYSEHFVEQFHPDTNCDKIAWLDDAYCCQDNETDNISHWCMFASDICTESEDRELCRLIYENDGAVTDEVLDYVKSVLPTDRPFYLFSYGEHLAEKYADEIQSTINEFEFDIMGETLINFGSLCNCSVTR